MRRWKGGSWAKAISTLGGKGADLLVGVEDVDRRDVAEGVGSRPLLVGAASMLVHTRLMVYDAV